MSESTARGNGAAGPPSFRPADPAPRDPGLSMDSGLAKIKRPRAAMNADPNAAPRQQERADPPEQQPAHEEGGTEDFGFGDGESGDETFELTIDGRSQRV